MVSTKTMRRLLIAANLLMAGVNGYLFMETGSAVSLLIMMATLTAVVFLVRTRPTSYDSA